MRKILYRTRTRQRGSKKIFWFIFLASLAKFRQLYVKHTPSEILILLHILHTPLTIGSGWSATVTMWTRSSWWRIPSLRTRTRSSSSWTPSRLKAAGTFRRTSTEASRLAWACHPTPPHPTPHPIYIFAIPFMHYLFSIFAEPQSKCLLLCLHTCTLI
jgi:hypothetical protein